MLDETNQEIIKDDLIESKQEKFIRLSQKRVSVILKGLDILENLSTTQYESTPEMQYLMFEAIGNKLEKVKMAFQRTVQTGKERTFKYSPGRDKLNFAEKKLDKLRMDLEAD